MTVPVSDLVEEAILRERERCAAIADDYADEYEAAHGSRDCQAAQIAKDIRESAR